jgi:hypothetical protein
MKGITHLGRKISWVSEKYFPFYTKLLLPFGDFRKNATSV